MALDPDPVRPRTLARAHRTPALGGVMVRVSSCLFALTIVSGCITAVSGPASSSPATSPTAVTTPGSPGAPTPTRSRRPRRTQAAATPSATATTTSPTASPTEPPSPTASPTEPPPPTAALLADLVVEGFFTEFEAVQGGDLIRSGFSIRNAGQAPSGPFHWTYSYSFGALAGTDDSDSLDRGESNAFGFNVTAPEESTYVTVSVQVDSENEVVESDEGNNEDGALVQVICLPLTC